MNRRVVLVCLTLFSGAACSDGGGSSNVNDSTVAPGATADGGGTVAPTTTIMADCAQMPAVADLAEAVGIPLDTGRVSGTGSCEYLGLNDQSRSVTLSILTDSADQASFTDLQASLGASTPLNDTDLPEAMIGPSFIVYVAANDAIYAVQTLVTDGSALDQVPLSAAVLKHWLTV